ncbi:MAG: hypothetical protein U0798_15085 [Gemmataceae bacterium]
MILIFGQYRFPVDGVECTTRTVAQRTNGGVPYLYTTEITGEGQFIAAGPQALSALQLQAELAFAQINQDFLMLDDTGAATSIRLLSAGAEPPGVVVDGFDFPESRRGDMATGRSFRFRASASYPTARAFGAILHYQEKVAVQGNGGPLVLWQPAFNGPSVPVRIRPSSETVVIQSGSAVGYGAYPTPPPPILSAAYLVNPDQAVERTSPRANGTEFGIAWRYVFRFPGGLSRPPLPNVFIG